jgi:hypothetical protein
MSLCFGIFTGDRFVGVVDFTSMLIEDDVLQHCNRNIQIPDSE